MFNNKLTLAKFFIYFTKYKSYLNLYNNNNKKNFNIYNKNII